MVFWFLFGCSSFKMVSVASLSGEFGMCSKLAVHEKK
jgi:hypothetical protein